MIYVRFASGANVLTSLVKRLRASLESRLRVFSHARHSFPSVAFAPPSIKLSSALSFAPPAV